METAQEAVAQKILKTERSESEMDRGWSRAQHFSITIKAQEMIYAKYGKLSPWTSLG